MHTPLFLFGAVIGGSAEAVVVALMAGLWLVMAIGLIRKWKVAWYLGLFWQIYTFVFFLAFLIPGMLGRFIAYEEDAMSRWSPPGAAGMMPSVGFFGPIMAISFGLGLVIVIVFTVALFKRKEDYLGA
jgi:hypothetical protein